MALFKSAQELMDTVSFLGYCVTDQSALLSIEHNTGQLWVPTIKVLPGGSWLKELNKDLQDVFGANVQICKRILRYYKLWIPNHKYPYLHQCVFEVQVNPDQKKKSKNVMGKYRGKLRWVTQEELLKCHGNAELKSPEVLDYVSLVKNTPAQNYQQPPEFVFLGNLMEINDDVFVVGKNSVYEQIVALAGLDQLSQEMLYREFLLLTFPATFMDVQVFGQFVNEIGWPKDETRSLFRSADVQSRNGISFRELLYFLAVVEPGTTHGGAAAEMRCRYIFRFYDNDKNNLLKYDEVKNLTISIRKSKKQPMDAPQVTKDVSDCYKAMGYKENYALTVPDFLRAVGELKIRGTSQIYRAPTSIQKYIKDVSDREGKTRSCSVASKPSIGGKPVMTVASAPSTNKSGMPYRKTTEYDLAVHTVKIQKSGTAINVDQLWTLDRKSCYFRTCLMCLKEAVTFSSTRQPTLNDNIRKLSLDQFSQNSQSNQLLKALRYLGQNNQKACYVKPEQINYNWGKMDPETVAKHLISVCGQVKGIFMKEPRLLDLSSPVYIMGDIHGNLSDLLYFERIFWHVGPGLCPSTLLFLGDYVDRGLYSIEVISYLFCYKLQSPHKVKMIRGNHEIRRVQIQWTFEKECKLKFGANLGSSVFNTINDTFNTMPLAAVVDGRVFCCHGGIPPPWLCPLATAINDIPVNLTDPLEQSPLAWELMWNDPVRQKHITDKMTMELLANEGFANNTRRGTAHVFSVDALEKFLKANGFTHLIRAHEVVEAGFNVQQKGKLLTVFSSSKYCGGKNEAACVLADQSKLRILRLQTE